MRAGAAVDLNNVDSIPDLFKLDIVFSGATDKVGFSLFGFSWFLVWFSFVLCLPCLFVFVCA